MQYHHVVNAIQLKKSIYDENGEIVAKAGDWIITDSYEQYYMTHVEFNKKYSSYYPASNGWTWGTIPYGVQTTSDSTILINKTVV